MRGVLHSLAALFCQQVYVRELQKKSEGLAIGYRIAWV